MTSPAQGDGGSPPTGAPPAWQEPLDSVVVAGRLLDPVPSTPETASSESRAILIRAGHIVDVLDARLGVDVALAGDADLIDLSQHTVTPGFFDAHNHQPSAARDVLEVATAHVTSITALAEEVHRASADREAGVWIFTERNLSRAQLAERRYPTARELDAVSTEHPIVVRFGAHSAALNSRALQESGLARMTTDPAGGRLERDADGAPVGPIHEYGALKHVDAQHPPVSDDELVEALATVQDRYLASGITAVRIPGVRPGELEWYQRLRERGEPLVRIFAAIRVDPNLPQGDKLALIDGWPVRTGFGDDRLAVDGLKLFVDGGVDGEPDDPSTLFLGVSELTDVVTHAAARGWSVACHANTSKAVGMVLDAYQSARAQGLSAPTLVIEHGLHATTDQLRRAADLRVWLSTQPGLLEINDHVLGAGVDASSACPLRSALQAGVRIALGSDWNATPGTQGRPYAPARSLFHACRDRPEAIDPRTALYLHTRAPAELVGHPSLGLLTRGAPADLVAFPGHLDVDDLCHSGTPEVASVMLAGHHVSTDALRP